MNDDESDSQLRNLNQSLVRRLLIVSQNMEESVRINGQKIEDLTRLLAEQKDSLRNMREQLNDASVQKLFYIFLGISIGLAGREILKDVLQLMSR